VRAIVTGGAGFIGSHVVDALVARGDEVVVVDDLSRGRRENVNEGARLLVADIRDATAVGSTFADVRPDVCFHLAAQADVRVSVENPGLDADVNVLGTIRILEAAHEHGAQIVFSSTGGAIYGECEEPAPETAERRPLAPYGTSKLAGEEYLATYNRLYGERHVALRFGNVYGPRQDPHGEAGVVAIFFGRLADGRPFRIFGDGRQTRDYVYVGDVAEATLAAAGHAGGVFNVGTGAETSVLELAGACRRVSGVDLEPKFAPARLGELQRSFLATELAERELGFRARTDLDAGLGETWRSIVAEGEAVLGSN
jgi:UDP-glucose 4-epimerase